MTTKKGDYRTGFTVPKPEPPSSKAPKFKPAKAPPCPKLTGKKREPCEGKGKLLTMAVGSTLPNAVQAHKVYDPKTGTVSETEQTDPIPHVEPFEPLADRYYWYRCDTCGHKFSVRGEAKAAKK